jgi:SagB-type dehydrogenase family enzyme
MHGEPPTHRDRLLAFRPLDPTNRPAPLKTYTGVETVLLPSELRQSSLPAVEVLSGHHAEPGRLDDSLLGTLLFLAAGVTRVARTADGGHIWFRSAMSAGNLHPVEVYVVGDDVHHYHPLDHALVRLRRGVHVCDNVTLVLTGIPFRTCWKYGERGWRHLWWDAGALLANLVAAADAHGVPAQIMAGFPDAAVAPLVGIDGVDEVPLALVRLGSGELRLPSPDALEPVAARADPVARRVLRFPLVVEAHTETALDLDAVAGWQRAALAVSKPAPATVEPPPVADPDDRVESVILRRGSTRLFRRQRAPSPLLEWVWLRPLVPCPSMLRQRAHCSSTSSACTTSPTPNRAGTATPPPEGSRDVPAARIPAPPVPTSALTSPWAATPHTRSSTPQRLTRSSTRSAAAATEPPNSKRASPPDDWRSTRSLLVMERPG